jgi:hypothetical protein
MSKPISLRLSDDLAERIQNLKGTTSWPKWLKSDPRVMATFEPVSEEDMETWYQLNPEERPRPEAEIEEEKFQLWLQTMEPALNIDNDARKIWQSIRSIK